MNLKRLAIKGVEAYALGTAFISVLYELQTYVASFSNPQGMVLIVTNNFGERMNETIELAAFFPAFVFLVAMWLYRQRKIDRLEKQLSERMAEGGKR